MELIKEWVKRPTRRLLYKATIATATARKSQWDTWVDTGAYTTCVSWEKAKTEGVKIYDLVRGGLRGMGNGALQVHGAAVLKITIGSLHIQCIAAVIEAMPTGCDLLLGLHDLQQNQIDLFCPWDSAAVLNRRAAKLPAPSLLMRGMQEFAIEEEAIMTEEEDDKTFNATAIRSAYECRLDAAGRYLIKARLPPGVRTATHIVSSIVTRPEGIQVLSYDYLVTPEELTVNIAIRKEGAGELFLPRGTILGRLEMTPVESVHEVDVSGLHFLTTKLTDTRRAEILNLLQGDLSTVTESASERVLRDPEVEQRERKKAQTAIQELHELRKDKLRFTAEVERIRDKTKTLKKDGLQQDEASEILPGHRFTGVGAERWNEDGDEVDAAVAAVTMPVLPEGDQVEGDTTLDLEDLEFLIHQEVYDFTDGTDHGKMIDTEPIFFETVVTRLLIYRAAGRFRLNYNKVLPTIPGVAIDIELLNENVKPSTAPRAFYSDKESTEVLRQCAQLLKAGILCEQKSSWNAGLVLAKKAGGDLRMCVNYRGLNGKTKPIVQYLPEIREIMRDSFQAGDLFYSQLDLSQAYHQLRVTQRTKELLAFSLPRVLGTTQTGMPLQVSWNVLPFGTKEGPAAFQALMQMIFLPHGLATYLDDLGRGDRTKEAHLERLDKIMQLAARYNLTFGSKCTFFRAQIKHLGHMVSRHGIRLAEDRVSAILALKAPRTTKEVLRYRGIVMFCAEFMGPKVAARMSPLSDVLRKGTRWPWSPQIIKEIDQAVLEIKELLTNAETLQIFDPKKAILITTDGSKIGIGAGLFQEHEQVWRPVHYLSKKLTTTQRNWHPSQLELFALLTALRRWRIYLIDKPFRVITDHAALRYLQNGTLFQGARLQRWQLLLSEFQFFVEVKPGTMLGLPDALSRDPIGDDFRQGTDDAELVAYISTLDNGMLMPISEEGRKVQGTSSRQLLGVIPRATAIGRQWEYLTTEPEEIIQLFKKGDRVSTDTVWPGRRYFGIIHERYWGGIPKGRRHKPTRAPDIVEYKVRWDDGSDKDTVIAQHHLQTSDRRSLMPGALEDTSIALPTGALTAQASDNSDTAASSNTTDMIVTEIQQAGIETSPSTPRLVATDNSTIATETFGAGDIVEVSLGFEERFRKYYGKNVLCPLGIIQAQEDDATSGTITVRLLLPAQPTVLLKNKTSLRMIASRSLLESLLQTEPIVGEGTFQVGDTVMVYDRNVTEEIVTQLQNQDIDVSYRLSHGRLVGVVTQVLQYSLYMIHFGNFFSGVYKLRGKQLVRIRKGAKTQLISQLTTDGTILKRPLTEEERQLLDESTFMEFLQKRMEGWQQKLITEQAQDPKLQIISEYLLHGTISPLLTDTQRRFVEGLRLNYEIIGHVLFEIRNGRRLILVPATLQSKVLELIHDEMDHFDTARTLAYGSQFFHWREMREQLTRYVRSCFTCQVRRRSLFYTKLVGGEYATRVIYSQAGKYWAMDLHAMEKDVHGNTHALVIICLTSCFVIFVPLLSKDAETVIRAIELNLVQAFGRDITVMFDLGAEFMNYVSVEMFARLHIKVVTIKRATPQENGKVERWMDTFMSHMAKAINARTMLVSVWGDWGIKFGGIYNHTYNPQVGHTPYFRMYGKELDTRAPGFGISVGNYTTEADNLCLSDQQMRDLLLTHYSKWRRLAEIDDLLEQRFKRFAVGDLVLIHLAHSNDNAGDTKLRLHAGPFEVLKHDANSISTYHVCGADRVSTPVHIYKLGTYHPSEADLYGVGKLAASAIGAATNRLFIS